MEKKAYNGSSVLVYMISFVVLQLGILFYSQTFILTDDFYRLIIGYQITDRQLDDYLDFVHKWRWISYVFIPPALLLRIFFTWICLKIGSFFVDQFMDSSLWKICVKSEIVFAVSSVASLLYNEFLLESASLERLSVNPFSLHIFFADSLPSWCAYLFNTINIFELSYVLVIAYFIANEARSKFTQSLKFVATTYLPGLALWVLLLSYLSVVFQP